MKQLSLKALSLTLFVAASLNANAPETTQIYLSEVELQEIFSNPKRSYVYVGKEISNIANIIEEVSKLEDNQNSAVWGLKNHIDKGFVIGNYDAVAQALEQADVLLKKHVDADASRALSQSLNDVITQVTEDNLTLDAEILAFAKDQVNVQENDATRSGLRLLVVDERMNIHGRVKFYKDAFFKDHATFDHYVKFKGNTKFEKNVAIEGNLSVTDLVVASCVDSLCISNLSVANEIIGNITVGTLSATDLLATNGTVGALSVTNVLATNATITGLSAGSEIISCDLTVGCNISMVDSTSAAVGNVIKNGAPFIHNYPGVTDNNTYVGNNSGNFTMSGAENSGFGVNTLLANTTGGSNTAIGYNVLASNTTGFQNSAVGGNALAVNTVGAQNTAVGFNSLPSNTTGSDNIAIGYQALLLNTTGIQNTAIGSSALLNNTIGFNNVAIGQAAGTGLVTGSGNNYIGAGVAAASAGETGVTRISNIRGTTTGVADAIQVLIDSTGQLGVISSSKAVKHNIQDMNDVSSSIYALNPVTFVYNSDASETTQYGLIAEEVADVFPGIVVNNISGQPETIQYHVLPVLMLNEFKKLAARVAVLEAHLN
jgi:hypothetical protein